MSFSRRGYINMSDELSYISFEEESVAPRALVEARGYDA
jgi:hypothetical protein